jgi:CO/xanthine dehydrogenase FAD-binding subunit
MSSLLDGGSLTKRGFHSIICIQTSDAWAARMYARPSDLDDALGLLAEGGARIIAGATDIFPGAGERPLHGDYVDVSNISALRGVCFDSTSVRIGATTTWSDIARADLPPAFDALKVAARDVGAAQIQNRGTIAGNLCNASPAADGAPPLLILDAEVELASRRGTRRLALDVFINGARSTVLAPGEVMTAIITPLPASTMRSAFFKLGARRYLVISIVMVAAALDVVEGVVRDARIAIGACSVVALRMTEAERRLIGAPAGPDLGLSIEAKDLARLSPIDDVRAGADYRRDAALTLLRRAIDACALRETGGVV